MCLTQSTDCLTMTTMQATDDVRAFNRFYTRRVGLLTSKLAGSRFTLSESRVLYEIAHRGEAAAVEIGRDLDIDSGYLSRIVNRFVSAGLVERRPTRADARKHLLQLTASGREAFADLDALQTKAIDDVIGPLAAPARADLTAAMSRIRRVLGDKPAGPGLVLRTLRPGDLGWVIERHGTLYAAEYGWDTTFEALVARVCADFGERADPSGQAGWIAEIDGERAGCVFCIREDPQTARLRLLLVDPAARGAGVGARLVDECLRFARASGYQRITLWTQSQLVAARKIYAGNGFRLDSSRPHRSFGADLVEEDWSLDLRDEPVAPLRHPRGSGRSQHVIDSR